MHTYMSQTDLHLEVLSRGRRRQEHHAVEVVRLVGSPHPVLAPVRVGHVHQAAALGVHDAHARAVAAAVAADEVLARLVVAGGVGVVARAERAIAASSGPRREMRERGRREAARRVDDSVGGRVQDARAVGDVDTNVRPPVPLHWPGVEVAEYNPAEQHSGDGCRRE